MRYFFSKLTLVGIIVYTILCIQGLAKPPQHPAEFGVIAGAYFSLVILESKNP